MTAIFQNFENQVVNVIAIVILVSKMYGCKKNGPRNSLDISVSKLEVI
jgi:hypothetical protein